MKTSQSDMTRRSFIGAAGATAVTILPGHVLGQSAPSNLINVAVVGAGGHGAFVITQMLKAGGIKVAALCDVDAEFASHVETQEYGSRRITGLYRQFPDVPKYRDFRIMLDQEQNNIDAVVVTTPEHIHVSASAMAMKIKKHVYCSKLLGHNVHEIRLATQLAEQHGVITQMDIGFGITTRHPQGGFSGKYVATRDVVVSPDSDGRFELELPLDALHRGRERFPASPVGLELFDCWALTHDERSKLEIISVKLVKGS